MSRVFLTGLFEPYRFEEAISMLTAAGYAVVSAYEYDGDTRTALENSLSDLTCCAAVVTLPGWEHSPGTVIEVTLAAALGIPVLSLQDALSGA